MTLETLMAGCIDRAEADGEAGVEVFLSEHPEHADQLRKLLGSLHGMGLIHAPAEEEDVSGGVVGDFRLLSRLGEGGMGVVWLAAQVSVERFVALKVIHPALAVSSTARARFRREARAIAALRHPNVVTILAAGEEGGQLWLAMEYIEGTNLDERLRERGSAQDVRSLVAWTAQVARGLGAVHAAGFVHRDVKPSNIRIDREERALLLDFGLARDAESETLTASGSFQGTPVYASPEQLEGRRAEIGPASDVYSLGATLYEALAGKLPFEGKTTLAILRRMQSIPLTPLRQVAPGVPRDLETVVAKALEVDPGRRYRSGDELAEDLEAVLAFQAVCARPAGPLRRANQWIRGHRLLASVTVLLLAALFAVCTTSIVQSRAARLAREVQARDLVQEAQAKLVTQRSLNAPELLLERDLAERGRVLLETGASREAWEELDRDEAILNTQRQKRAELFADLHRALDQAERLAPRVAEHEALRAELHVEQLRYARAAGTTAEARFHEARIQAVDAGELHADFVAQRERVALRFEAAGAEIGLYRYVPAHSLDVPGGRRLIAVPWRGWPENIEAGATVLRVVVPSGELLVGDPLLEISGHPVGDSVLVGVGNEFVARGDRLISIGGVPVRTALDARELSRSQSGEEFLFSHFGEEYRLEASEVSGLVFEDPFRVACRGGVEALVWRAGRVFETRLEPGVVLRPTASPLLPCEEASWDPSAGEFQQLEAGSYVALASAPGLGSARIPFDVEHGTPLELVITLPPSDGPGSDWVPIVAPHSIGASTFWAQDHEVTCAEYLEFLNDPEVLAQVFEAGAEPMRYPRDSSTLASGSFFRVSDGLFHLGKNDQADTPIYGIHAADAEAYAAWLTRRSRESGDDWQFSLPTVEQHEALRRTSKHRRFVTGESYRPHAIQSGPAKSVLLLEPVFSYPLDEDPRGLYDLAGGVSEWLATPHADHSRRRWLAGGSWSQRQAMQFELDYRYVSGEVGCYATQGMRLVATRP